MDVKEKTLRKLEDKVENLEDIIAKKGIGSEYLGKAERVQRNLNLALIVGSTAVIFGFTAWSIYHFKD